MDHAEYRCCIEVGVSNALWTFDRCDLYPVRCTARLVDYLGRGDGFTLRSPLGKVDLRGFKRPCQEFRCLIRTVSLSPIAFQVVADSADHPLS